MSSQVFYKCYYYQIYMEDKIGSCNRFSCLTVQDPTPPYSLGLGRKGVQGVGSGEMTNIGPRRYRVKAYQLD